MPVRAEFERNKTPIDAVMGLPTRFWRAARCVGGRYNAKRHERMLWGPVGKWDEIGGEEEEEKETRVGWHRQAGGAKSGPLVE